ncbi:MAG: hypothetical protein Q9225_006914 [Loekoesia sp. 1 TL-2023]
MEGGDGPLILTLLLANQNRQHHPELDGKDLGWPIPDTVAIERRTHVLEYRPASPLRPQPLELPDANQGSSQSSETAMMEGGDGPLILGLRLANLNLNHNHPKSDDSYQKPLPDTEPIPDTVAIESQSNVFEYLPASTSNTKYALPYVSRLKDPNRFTDEIASSMQSTEESIGLTSEQRADWDANGYLVLPESLDKGTTTALIQDVRKLAASFFDELDPSRISHEVSTDTAPLRPNGRLIAALADVNPEANPQPLQRIRRIGTGVHRHLPLFRSITFSRRNRQIARSLGFSKPHITQSLIVPKASASGAKVIPHQDGCSNFTDPPSSVTFWYALEDATIQNGCLMVVPGSHKTTPISRRCVVSSNGYPEFQSIQTPLFAPNPGSNGPSAPTQAANHGMNSKKLEVKAGTLILMHGNLVHASEKNDSANSRIAYNFGLVEGSLPWKADNYLQPYDGETEFESLM